MIAETKFPPFLISAPRCPKCGAQTILVRVFLERLGEKRLYECLECEHEVTEASQFRASQLERPANRAIINR
jgi:hypothetical protein